MVSHGWKAWLLTPWGTVFFRALRARPQRVTVLQVAGFDIVSGRQKAWFSDPPKAWSSTRAKPCYACARAPRVWLSGPRVCGEAARPEVAHATMSVASHLKKDPRPPEPNSDFGRSSVGPAAHALRAQPIPRCALGGRSI